MTFFNITIDAWAAVPALLALSGALAALLLKRKVTAPDRRRRAVHVDPGADTLPGNAQPAHPANRAQHFSEMIEVRQHLNPLTEAEVFMALGRDQEAEQLLLEAIRTQPTKISLRVKLAELYSKRPDAVAFQSVAFKLRLITGSRGPVWADICRMGREVDRTNPEYRNMQAAATRSAFALDTTYDTPHDADDFAETVFSEPAPLVRVA